MRVALHNIAGNHGVIDAVDDLIGALLVVLTERHEGEAAEANIIFQRSLRDNGLSCLNARYSLNDSV